MKLTREELAACMDYTLLKPEATASDIDRVCADALRLSTASVCVNPCWVSRVAESLSGSTVATCTVIGFPLGATSTEAKVAEASRALRDGARELDMVINIGMLRAGESGAVQAEIAALAERSHDRGALLKVIIETCLLTDEQKRVACVCAKRAGADFVKTSTGFSTGGATVEDVRLMRDAVGQEMGVKASGGIRTLASALAMIEAGASRLGVSAAASILDEVGA